MAPRHNFLFKGFLFLILVVCISCPPLAAKIIDIPSANFPTIQSGIDSAQHGDTVLVQPDRYIENINFNAKNIIVGSLFITTGDTSYISQTIIDGNESGCVVVFENGEDSTACLSGFTITKGYGFADANQGAGISCLNNSSPILTHLIVENNEVASGSNGGAGILAISKSKPQLQNLIFRDNESKGSYGGAIRCVDSSNVTISNSKRASRL